MNQYISLYADNQALPTDVLTLPDGVAIERRTDGVLIRIGRNVRPEQPIQLESILAAPVDITVTRHIHIVAEPGSQACILLCDRTHNASRHYLVNELIEVTVEAGATLTLDRVEETSLLTEKHSTLNGTLGPDSRFSSTAACITCGRSLNRISLRMDAPGAQAMVNGMVIASDTQAPEFETHIVHNAEHTASAQTFKYVADGQSQCAFRGLIVVKENARFTEAYQTNHNLLASTDARMHAEPALEIYCDEVKCSHGATTGQLDPQALFYMRSRGIPEAEARRMLMEAFLADVIDGVGTEGLRDHLRRLVERRFSSLAQADSLCPNRNIIDPC